MTSPTEITVKRLERLIGTPNAPVLIDICIDDDFAEDPRLIPGAFRWSHRGILALAPRLANRKAVVICQKGKKLSQGAAAALRAAGCAAETLEGGVHAWRDAGAPLVPVAAWRQRDGAGPTLWVTRHRPKVERIACSWLIRRFIDPGARFLFVAPSEVMDVAEKFDATPFDALGAPWTHHGDRCTFDAMLAGFALRTPALETMADIVRGADADDLSRTPQSAGLLAISLGLSRQYRDDLAQLQAGLAIYDALYYWARDARDETHDWTPEASA